MSKSPALLAQSKSPNSKIVKWLVLAVVILAVGAATTGAVYQTVTHIPFKRPDTIISAIHEIWSATGVEPIRPFPFRRADSATAGPALSPDGRAGWSRNPQ